MRNKSGGGQVEYLRELYAKDPDAFQAYLSARVKQSFGLPSAGTNNKETTMQTQTRTTGNGHKTAAPVQETKMKSQLSIDENKIEMTEDYDMFKFVLGNRQIDEKHVVRLMAKMEAHDLFTPIMVNEKLEIIDGQHRLEARRRLKLIVPYYVSPGAVLRDVQALNEGQKNWTTEDFTQSFIAQGNENYKQYAWFKKRYNLNHTVAFTLLHGGRSAGNTVTEIFKSGNMRIKDLSGAMKKAEILEKIAPLFEEYASKGFTSAFFFCLDKKCFDVERFIKKLAIYPNLRKCATKDQYIALIEEIYNYHAREQISIRYSE